MSASQATPPDVLVVVYAARSDKNTENDQTGQQVAAVRAKLEREGGRQIVDVYEEDDRSGFRGDRGPELAAAMAHAIALADEGATVELWTWKSNRLGRGSGRKGEARSVTEVLTHLLRNGVSARSVSDDQFVTTPMLWGFAAEQANKYSADLSADVKRGKERQWHDREWTGGPVPDGYRSDGAKSIELDPEREPVIRHLWALALEGRAPAPLARELNAAGLRTRGGNRWTRRRVQDTLANAVYAGLLVRHRGTPRGQRQSGGFDAYVTLDEFKAVAHHARGRDVTAAGRARAGSPSRRFLVARLACCGRCGGPAYSVTSTYKRKDGTRRRVYMCGEVKHATGLCDAPAMRGDAVDSYVLAHLTDFTEAAERWLRAIGHDRQGAESAALAALAAAEAERDEFVGRVTTLEDRYVRQDDLDSPQAESILSMIVRHRADLARAQRAVQRAADELAAVRRAIEGDELEGARRALADAHPTGATATLAELNRMLRDHFDAFVLTGDDERPAVPLWKLEVPATIGKALAAAGLDTVLDDALSGALGPYLETGSGPEHNRRDAQAYLWMKPKRSAFRASHP